MGLQLAPPLLPLGLTFVENDTFPCIFSHLITRTSTSDSLVAGFEKISTDILPRLLLIITNFTFFIGLVYSHFNFQKSFHLFQILLSHPLLKWLPAISPQPLSLHNYQIKVVIFTKRYFNNPWVPSWPQVSSLWL
jgi:hypothetical protein